MAEPKKGGDASAFIQEYTPIAESIGKELNVDPRIILAKFGVETGWGKSVVPGTYNLGNIKDFSGSGVPAVDNKLKTRDNYMKFEDPEVFAAYYADMMKRRFPDVIGAGSDVNAFTQALKPGQKGGYAEDKQYGDKLNNAFSLVTARIESAQPKQEDEFGFGSGQTEGQRIAQEPPSAPVEREGVVNKEDAALAGAGAGLAAGIVAGNTKQPTSPRLEAAQERLQVARDKLDEVRSRAGTGVSLDDLENDLRMRQLAAQQAADELRVAQAELRATTRPTPVSAAAEVADDLPGRKVPGASGASNWVRAMGQDVPDVVAETAENMRKDNPKGGQAIIDRDVAAKQKIQQLGASDYKLTGQGKGQLMLPPELAAEKTAALESELTQRQAADAAERTRLANEAESRRIAAENRAELARRERQRSGMARREADQAVKQARTAQGQVQRAQSGVNVAQQAVERAGAAKPGVLGQVGAATAKVAPKALGVISGAATGMAAMDAIEKFKQGDYSGAVLPTLEATFGVMSMLPPAHPILLALRGLGTVGGTALAGYEGYKAIRGEPQTEK